MAIRTPDSGYNALRNSILSQGNINQAEINTRQSHSNIDAINKQHELAMWQAGVQAADLALTFTKDLYNIHKAAQLEEAKNDVLNTQPLLQQKIYESLASGNTYMGADGKMVIDQGLLDWQQAQLDAVDASKGLKEVKQWKKQALLQTFQSGQGVLMEAAYKNYAVSYEQSFANNLDLARRQDIASGTTENGKTIISSRADWSPVQKAAAIQSYEIGVKKDVDTKIVSNIAAKEGIARAIEVAYALEGYSPDEIHSMVATASKTDQQLTASAVTTVSNLMSSGLASGESASDIWERIDNALSSVPEDRKQQAIASAKSAQVAWATEEATKMYVGDLDADLEFLTERRNSIKDGPIASQLFYNIPEVQDTFVNLYDKQIASTQKIQKDTDSSVVKINKTSMDSVFQSFINGEISGESAISIVMAIGENTESQEDDVYAMQFITKIKDSAVPSRYKPAADEFIKGLEKINFGLKGKREEFTPEQESQLAERKTWTYGAIASLFMESAASTISIQEFASTLADIKNIFVSDALDSLGAAKINQASASKDMANLAYDLGKSNLVYSKDGGQKIEWASEEVKTAFDKVGGQLSSELERNGVTLDGSAPHPLSIGGSIFAVPQVRGTESDGKTRWYTVDRNEVFSSEDGGQTWQQRWTIGGTKLDKNKVFSAEPKIDKTPVNTFFDQFRGSTNNKPVPKLETSDKEKEQVIPAQAAKIAEDYRKSLAPTEQEKKDNAILDKLGTDRVGGERKKLLRNLVSTWMDKNEDKAPNKENIAKNITFITDEMIEAMYRIIKRERGL